MPRVNWTPEIDAALGTMSDNDIVKHFGLMCHYTAVKERRDKFGISSFRPRTRKEDIVWTPELDALLSTEMSAREILERCGFPNHSRACVSARRRMLGLPYKPNPVKFHSETRNGVKNMIGKYSDAEIARAFKTSTAYVLHLRRSMGIPVFKKEFICSNCGDKFTAQPRKSGAKFLSCDNEHCREACKTARSAYGTTEIHHAKVMAKLSTIMEVK